MWDTIAEQTSDSHLSHDLPCPRCGHEAHRYVACDSDAACGCPPHPFPGDALPAPRRAQ